MNATPPDIPPPSQPVIAPIVEPSRTGAPPPDGWAVGANRGAAWWSEGWRLFTASPVIWIVITLLYVALMIGLHLIPLVGQIAGTLLTPVLAGGVLLGCRALDRGGELTVGHLFAAFGFGSLSALLSGDPMQMMAALGAGALVMVLIVLLIAVPLVMASSSAPAP